MTLLRVPRRNIYLEGEVVIPRETKLPRDYEVRNLVLQLYVAIKPVRLLSIVFGPLPVIQVMPDSAGWGNVGISARSLTQVMTCYTTLNYQKKR